MVLPDSMANNQQPFSVATGQPPILSTLLSLAQESGNASSLDQAAYVMVNRTFELVSYRTALLWQHNGPRGGRVTHVSGLAIVEHNTPFLLWMRDVCGRQDAETHDPYPIERGRLPPELADAWDHWLPEYLLWVPLPAPEGLAAVGALCLARDSAFDAMEQARLAALARFYGHTLWAWQRGRLHFRVFLRRFFSTWTSRILLLTIFGALLYPFNQSVIVPAEVVPIAPITLASPAEGTIQTVLVHPGETVQTGTALFMLDDTDTRNRLAVARKSLALAQAEWLRASQKAFGEEEARAEVTALGARIEERRAEANYLDELLHRLTVTAPIDGVVLFNDPTELMGKPVVIGERIMTLANPAQVGVQAWLPPFDAIALAPGTRMVLSLHTAPLSDLEATLVETSYETQMAPDGSSAYRVLGYFSAGVVPHLGLKGTVRIYGDRASLLYQMLRRPLVTFRRMAGF